MHLEMEPTAEKESITLRTGEKQGLLFVLSAPSGTGKDSVIQALKQQGMDFHVVTSVTTRAPRPGESEGHPYHFISYEEFQQLVDNDELIEYANVHGHWYGQPRRQIKENLAAGRDVLLKVDVQGAATIRRKIPQAILIFLAPETHEELAQRLSRRQTEDAEQFRRRLADAANELAQYHWYDYLVINREGQLAQAVEQVRAIMIAEHCRVQPRYVEL
uniref:Guanylate kinase n=1 Tax=Thermogemmatispora argillosa TaxID=2045280 RepID=A0A455T7W1_9CHLR|nr:guanylate kinase [Thermogemmatispora argillosa]